MAARVKEKWQGRSEIHDALVGPTSDSLASKLGDFYLDLHSDWRWVSRRVETVDMVDLESRERRVSVDIHVAEVRRRAKAVGLDDYPELPVPIGLITKGHRCEW